MPLDNKQVSCDWNTVRRLLRQKNWFQFFRGFTAFLGKTDALFLQDLINREDMRQDRQDDIDSKTNGKQDPRKRVVDHLGYFLCTRKYLMNPKYHLMWSVKEQKTHFASLQKIGLIKVRQHDKRRWVKIDFSLICLKIKESTNKRMQ